MTPTGSRRRGRIGVLLLAGGLLSCVPALAEELPVLKISTIQAQRLGI